MPVLGLTGLREDGTPIPITAGDLNFDYWEFLRGPIAAAERGDSLALRAFIQPYAEREGIPLKAVQLVRTPYVLSANGVERRADEVVTNFDWKATP